MFFVTYFDLNILLKTYWKGVFMRSKRAELKIIDDSFDNWCIGHEEEINEILQSFIKISSETREIENQFIYVSSKGDIK